MKLIRLADGTILTETPKMVTPVYFTGCDGSDGYESYGFKVDSREINFLTVAEASAERSRLIEQLETL